VIADRLLAAAATAAIVAFGLSSESGVSWPVALVYAAAVFAGSAAGQLPPLPGAVQAGLRLLALAASAGAVLVTVLARQVPFIPETSGREWAGVVGLALTALVTIGLFSRRSLGPRFLLPTAVALLVAAGLGYSRPGFARTTRVPMHFLAPAAVAAALLWTWAVASGGPRPSRRGLRAFFGAAGLLSVALIVLLPLAQPHVERAVASALTGGTTGLDEATSLGDVASLAQSDRVVLRVWTARPQLLRAWAHDRFDGRGWTSAAAAPSEVPPLGPPAPALLRGASGGFFVLPPFGPGDVPAPGSSPTLVETRVVPAAQESWPLLTPASPVLVRAPLRWLQRATTGAVRGSETPALYAVASRPGARPGPAPGPDALHLPSALDPRVRALAASIAAGAATDRERIARTVAHLHAGYRYTLEVGSFRTGDPLAEFLFDKRAGYCEYFATAAAVLLRLQGVPARFVKGFSVGEHNQAAGHFVVRDRDAHAWVEVWIPGEGWIEADPTPPGDFAALHPPRPLAGLAEWIEGVRAALAQVSALLSAGEWRELASRSLGAATRWVERGLASPLAGATAAVAALGALLVWLWRRWRRAAAADAAVDAPAVPPELRALLRRLERHWARAGVARPPASALLEHVQRLPASALPPPAVDTSRRIADAYYEAAFAGRMPDASLVAGLAAELAALDEGRRAV
jgi:transglutaminase-like putative cysteine protease